MPLSEHEQRLLDQIERALYQEDPKFASTVRSTDLRTHMKRRLRRAALVLVLGFGLLLGGVVAKVTAIGIAGFVVMLGALVLALSSWKRLGGATGGTGGKGGTAGKAPLRSVGRDGKPRERSPQKRRPATSGSIMHRLEERWKRRWDERGH